MKFTAKEDFLHGRQRFEAGNSYTAERYGLTEADVKQFWAAGWVEVEGWDAAPERKPGARKLDVQNLEVTARG